MCGIIGVISNDGFKDKNLIDFMADGLITGSVRGSDSTGMYQITNDKIITYTYAKEVLTGHEFLQTPAALALVKKVPEAMITVAHHRAATHGSVTKGNAHPFVYTKFNDPDNFVIGVHNGTLTEWNRSIGKNKFEVDSEFAIHQMAVKGVFDAIKEMRGAYAFAVYDSSDPYKFHLATSGDRPLHFAFVHAGKTVIFASEARHLAWLADRNRLVIKGNEIKSMKAQQFVTFDLDGDLEKYQTTHIPYFYPPVRATRHMGPTSTDQKMKIINMVQDFLKKSDPNYKPEAPIDEEEPGDNIIILPEHFGKGFATAKENRFLRKALKLAQDQDAMFKMTRYDPDHQVMYGRATMKMDKDRYETFEGEMRRVTPEMLRYFNSGKAATDGRWLCLARGAYRNSKQDYVIVVSHPLID
jgi:hypothetical protein